MSGSSLVYLICVLLAVFSVRDWMNDPQVMPLPYGAFLAAIVAGVTWIIVHIRARPK